MKTERWPPRFLVGCAVVVFLVPIFRAVCEARARQESTSELESRLAVLASRAERVVDGRDRADVYHLLREAGRSGGTRVAGYLREIVERERSDTEINMRAQDALFRITEDEDYFRALIADPSSSVVQRSNAIRILARRPSTETDDLVRKVDRSTAENQVSGAASLYWFTRSQRQHYRELMELDRRLVFLIQHASTEYSPLFASEGPPEISFNPLYEWSRVKLLELSAEFPIVAAESALDVVREVADSSGATPPDSYVSLIEQLLAPKSREHFRSLRSEIQ